MGFRLYREVREFAPATWTQSELVVAWIIADDANDDSRRSWIALPLLCHYSRLTERGVRNALHGIAESGFEFRVIHGYGKDGRPVFAVKGHTVDYLVPNMLKGGTLMPPNAVDNPSQRRHDDAAIATSKAARIGPKGGMDLLKGGTLMPPLSSDPLTIPSTEEADLELTDVEGTQPAPSQDHHLNGRLPIERAALAAIHQEH